MCKLENKFPYETFPYEQIRLLEDGAKSLNLPISFLAGSILSAVSVAIGNTYKVQFKNKFFMKANIFIGLIGRTGNAKTPTLNLAFDMINKFDKRSYEEYKEALDKYNNLSVDDKKTEHKPNYKKYVLQDFTPEALVQAHSVNKKGIVILADELLGWIDNFGRYSNSGEQATYMSLWSGQPIIIDRKGAEPIRIDDTFLNIIGGVQQKLLSNLAKNNRGENGFLHRFLFVFDDDPSNMAWTDNEIDNENIINYEKMIFRLLSLDYNNNQSNVIHFSKKAKEHLKAWQNKAREYYFNDDLGHALMSKYDQYSIKFSLIIQLMFWASDDKVQKNEIELFAVEKAILLTEYFLNNAFKVNDIIYNVNPEVNLSQIEEQFFTSLTNEFTTAEAQVKGKALNIQERTIRRFLNNKKLFKKVKYGQYKKYNS